MQHRVDSEVKYTNEGKSVHGAQFQKGATDQAERVTVRKKTVVSDNICIKKPLCTLAVRCENSI